MGYLYKLTYMPVGIRVPLLPKKDFWLAITPNIHDSA